MSKEQAPVSGADRRRFLRSTSLAAAGAATLATLSAAEAQTEPTAEPADETAAVEPLSTNRPTKRDIAILKFLAAAELVETDLWAQYAELAQGNPGFRSALGEIDDSQATYAVDTADDELSHGEFINAYLRSIGEQPVDLDAFRTVRPPAVRGLRPVGRLTNLTELTVDTSYYTRYLSTRNPDLGATFPQIATIRGQSAIPTSNAVSARQLDGIARVASFHFAAIEQGGTSLYDQFVPFVSNKEVLRIVSSIYAVEAIHYGVFRQSLEGVSAFSSGDGKLVIPDLTNGRRNSRNVMPKRCDFLDRRLPTNSVIRPSSRAKAGAVAAATGLVQSGLFKGQPPAFFAAVTALARAADGLA